LCVATLLLVVEMTPTGNGMLDADATQLPTGCQPESTRYHRPREKAPLRARADGAFLVGRLTLISDRHSCQIVALYQSELAQGGLRRHRHACDVFWPKRMIVELARRISSCGWVAWCERRAPVSLGFRVGNPSAIGWYQPANFPASLLPVGVISTTSRQSRRAVCVEKWPESQAEQVAGVHVFSSQEGRNHPPRLGSFFCRAGRRAGYPNGFDANQQHGDV